jgi:hypothetical protein
MVLNISPFDGRGGGLALPPYLQARTAVPKLPGVTQPATQPTITPKSTVVPGEVNPATPPTAGFVGGPQLPTGMITPKPAVQPAVQPLLPPVGINTPPGIVGASGGPSPTLEQPRIPGMITPNPLEKGTPRPPIFDQPIVGTNPLGPGGNNPPAAPGGPSAQPPITPNGGPGGPSAPNAQTLFDFFKKDLENERDRSLGRTRASAASRGVFYGSPLTTSEGDIETSYNRGLGQLQAGILQNENQNELQRMQMVMQMLPPGTSFADMMKLMQSNPDIWGTIGSQVSQSGGQTPPTTPAQTPKNLAPKLMGFDPRNPLTYSQNPFYGKSK